MSYNGLSGNSNNTHKRMTANWRHVSQTFQLEISDQAWPELSTSGTKKINKKPCVTAVTHSSKLYNVDSKDVLSESHKSFSVDEVQRSSKYSTTEHSNDCQDTPDKHACSIDTLNFSMTDETCVEHTASKLRNTVTAEIVNNNFSFTQDKSDQVVSHKDSGVNGQKITGKDLKDDSKQCDNKKTVTNMASLYDNNFQNDFSLEFPTLDVNKKKANSKSRQLSKLGDKNCKSEKHSLHSNVKKPKAKDPICINILDVISTVTAKPKLIRGGTFDTSLLSSPSVSVIKPLRKRVSASAYTYGNPLDSDKPLRKKGKVRPNKKIKTSLLKAIVLKTREDKLKAKETAKQRLLDSKTILLDDVHVNSVDLNDNSVTKVFIKDKGKDDIGLHTVINDDEKKITPQLLHTRKFREYCNNYLTPGLIQSISLLIETIVRYQDRQYIRDPIKAHAKRRYVVGLREAKKYVRMKRVKLLIIAPDLERVPGKGGLDDTIQQLKSEAEIQNIPYLFGPNRKQLGKSSHKNVLVSCVAVLNYDGAEALVSKVLEYLLEARKKYSALTSVSGCSNMALTGNKTNTEKEQNKSVDTEVIVSLLEKLTCCDSNIKQKNTKDMGKHAVSSPFLAALENIL